ncbi:MAG: HAD-IIIA family hydrolase [Bacteroidales bacterium]|nr:HAD-IIIA family hydrolase [Bacteroidales bacterium]
MKTVMMAGGKGTRIASLRNDIPKPMIPVLGKSVLEWQIESLKRAGLDDITLVIGHLGDKIQDHFGDGSRFGVRIRYFVEDHPLGTAGALFRMDGLSEDFLLLNGDVLADIDWNRLIAFHRSKGAWASLVTHPNDHPYDSFLIETEMMPPARPGALPQDSGRIIQWIGKDEVRGFLRNRVNAGLAVLSPALLDFARGRLASPDGVVPEKVDLDRDVLRPCIRQGQVYAYDTAEYIKDMGTPGRLAEVERDLRSGKVASRALPGPRKAVFLDRDGVLNRHVGFLKTLDQMELLPGAAEAVRKINASRYLAIVVSNQPVIARGGCSFEELQAIHAKMETLLGREGAYLDAIYYCPHHPDRGFAGERPEYKGPCSCRKPAPGMLLQAAEDFRIDLARSYMIGDSESDVEAGRRAGCRDAFLIPSNEPGSLSAVLDRILAGSCHRG